MVVDSAEGATGAAGAGGAGDATGTGTGTGTEGTDLTVGGHTIIPVRSVAGI